MNIRDYQTEANRTMASKGKEKNILHMKLGIFTEFGEVLDIFKKNLAYDKPIDKVHLGEELADVCWYIVNRLTLADIIVSDKLFDTEVEDKISEQQYIDSLDIGSLCMSLTMIFDEHELNYYNDLLIIIKDIADIFNIDIEKHLGNNIEKLRVRYPEKFSNERALNRDLDSERKALEN